MRYFIRLFVFTLISSKTIFVFGQQGQWTWMKGDTTFNSLGHYGIQGVADPANSPPAMWGANGWVDQQGNFWLFGGITVWDMFNDLWKYDVSINMWIWVKGPGIPNQHGDYGIQGVPANSNLPKYRSGFTTWVDLHGDLWLFGGGDGMGYLNDLWRYQIATNQWTWMKGPPDDTYYVHYGTITVPAPENCPPIRGSASGGWVDNNGDLWMFGGYESGWCLNDIWRFNISTNNWTWMAGSDSIQALPEYGNQGIPSSLNTPGGRSSYCHWKDSEGNFWLFGGANGGIFAIHNDLWMFNPQTLQWTWMSGSDSPYAPATCLQGPCIPSVQNIPESRTLANACWKGICDYFYLFGGYGFWASQKSDLWCYSKLTREWTFVNGSLDTINHGFHGTMGIPGPANQPRGFDGSCSWTDLKGNFWFFGGRDSIGLFNYYHLNELWRYTPDTLCPIGQTLSTLDISNDTTICYGDSIELTASGGTSYHWSPETNISNTNISNPLIYPDSSTTYTVTIFVNNCHTSLSVYIKVNVDSLFTVGIQDTLICMGDSISLQATGGDNYLWQPDYHLSDPFLSNPVVFPDTSITYTVTIENKCFSHSIPVSIQVIQDSTKKILTHDTTLCKGEPLELTATGGILYSWNSGQHDSVITVHPSEQSIFIVTITDVFGCKNTDSAFVNIKPLPNIQINPPAPSICEGDSISLIVTGGQNYQWSPQQWIEIITDSNIIASPLQTITYTVVGAGSNLCSNSSTVTVDIIDYPISSLKDTNYLCDQKPLILQAGNDYSWTYRWQDGTMSLNYPVYTAGNYWVIIKNKDCAITDTTNVINCPEIWVPTAFTPDGDNLNDIFYAVASKELSSYHLRIFNRWGFLVFESDQIGNGWDGTYKGEDCMSDVYFWTVSYQIEDIQISKMLKGKVVLVR